MKINKHLPPENPVLRLILPRLLSLLLPCPPSSILWKLAPSALSPLVFLRRLWVSGESTIHNVSEWGLVTCTSGDGILHNSDILCSTMLPKQVDDENSGERVNKNQK